MNEQRKDITNLKKSTDKSNDHSQRDKVLPLKDVKNLNSPTRYEAYKKKTSDQEMVKTYTKFEIALIL